MLTPESLKHTRKRLGLSQRKLAKAAQIGAPLISDFEVGLRKLRPSEAVKLESGLKQVIAERAIELKQMAEEGIPA